MTKKVNHILTKRLKTADKSGKMAALAQESSAGNRSGFAGIFGTAELTDDAKGRLRGLLEQYAIDQNEEIDRDFEALKTITCEVKAINNQAALLHGERIKRAQAILKEYRDGAFTAWLMATYGNRQTPYNFLQYYEFYEEMPKTLRPQIESMPRQAVYTLASRNGDMRTKKEIVEEAVGKTKDELLNLIRGTFPLPEKDQRRKKLANEVISSLKRIHSLLKKPQEAMTEKQKKSARYWLQEIDELLL
jgi:hypothetical protein